MADHYRTLGVSEDADQEVIRAAFRALAKRFHPDHGGDPDKFKRISKAGNILCDPDRRAKYDAWRAQRKAERQTTTQGTKSVDATPIAPDRLGPPPEQPTMPLPHELDQTVGGCGLIALVGLAFLAYLAVMLVAKEFVGWRLVLDLFVGALAVLGAMAWTTGKGASTQEVTDQKKTSVTLLCVAIVYFYYGFHSVPWKSQTKVVAAPRPTAAPTARPIDNPDPPSETSDLGAMLDTAVSLCDVDQNGVVDGRDWVRMNPGRKQVWVSTSVSMIFLSQGVDLSDKALADRAAVVCIGLISQLDTFYSVRETMRVPLEESLPRLLASQIKNYGW